MEISSPLAWFFAGIAFMVIEMLLPGFVVIFFAFGSFIASIAAWLLDISITIQTWIFIISSLLLLFSLRKLGIKLLKGDVHNSMNDNYADSRVGKNAVVTKKITPSLTGEIKFAGSFWRASSETEINEGETVVIVNKASEDGLTFMVKPLE
ncbi:conserved hypothetical protein [Desulfamplus magnetovallimortis]|uniref:NfeD-like C-terminal domain-containing protein n=1 Tax=Desulfamplus magnetovallimortis TaxID=1246637 RepID=A0A1W1H7A8_9BACT|nr:NfeD family protein [Desulfamplus magnetovallimortis]SLM28265.1 conserved hypothetical protein [Desulfamplus magnetovallimortis]